MAITLQDLSLPSSSSMQVRQTMPVLGWLVGTAAGWEIQILRSLQDMLLLSIDTDFAEPCGAVPG